MSFDTKFFRIAEDEINSRKLRNERILQQNEREIAVKQPEIYKIHRELCLTSAKLISLILNDEKDFERKLCELETNNELLQKRLAESLVRGGYPADFLEMPVTCKKCGDTGKVDGRRCECFMEVVKHAAAEEMNATSPLKLSDFKDFDLSYYDDTKKIYANCTEREIMSSNLDFCRRYAEEFHLPCNGILMRGATGLGKTHLSLSIAKEVINKGYSVIYASTPDLFRKCEQEQFRKAGEATTDTVMAADLLILDDVGAEVESKFNNAFLYNIINNRINALRPTIVSTNHDLNELCARYGDRVVSRLKTMDDLLFVGSDIRIRRVNN